MHTTIKIQNAAGSMSYDVSIEVWRDVGDIWHYEAWCGGITLVRGKFECISAQGAYDFAAKRAKLALS